MSKKLIIILVAVGVLVFGMMGAGFFVIWKKVANMPAAPAAVAEAPLPQEAPEPKDEIGATYPLETFIVNLADNSGNRYLRVTLELELDNETLKAEIDRRLPQVRDALLTLLPSKQIEEISTVEGKTRLREEIIDRLNAFFNAGEVTNVYFTEFVIQ